MVYTIYTINFIQNYTLRCLFLWVLMFDISVDWPNNTKFCTRNHQLYALQSYRTLEFVDPIPFPRRNCKIQYLQKVFKPKLQKMYLQIIVTLRYYVHAFIEIFSGCYSSCMLQLSYSWPVHSMQLFYLPFISLTMMGKNSRKCLFIWFMQ